MRGNRWLCRVLTDRAVLVKSSGLEAVMGRGQGR